MKTIAIASAKGGSCKTTCTATLAARAAKDSSRVAILDLNQDQGNLTDWWNSARTPQKPDSDRSGGYFRGHRGAEGVGLRMGFY